MSELDFQKIFASGASSQIDWTDDNYLKGWGYLGNVPPSYQSFDSLQRLNDLKFKYLYDEFMGIETNTEELISNHNENSEAHKTLFDKKLDKNGGTVTGNLNASGYNITATKFIGNLQGKADSAANADLAAKANQDSQGQVINTTYVKGITASNATLTLTKGNGTTSTVTINNVGNSTKATQDSQGQAINTTYIKSITASNATLTVTKGNGTTSSIVIDNVSHATNADTATNAMGDISGKNVLDWNTITTPGAYRIFNMGIISGGVVSNNPEKAFPYGVLFVAKGSSENDGYIQIYCTNLTKEEEPDNSIWYRMTLGKTYPWTPWQQIATDVYINNLLTQKFTASKQENGWWQDGNTGMIWQWAKPSGTAGNNKFPISFPNKALHVFATNTSSQGDAVDNAFAYVVDNATYYYGTKASNSNSIYAYPGAILAIGY